MKPLDRDAIAKAQADAAFQEHAGLICTGETYKDKVKLTFAHGAKLDDPTGLLDPGNGQTRAALDLREGDTLDEAAFKALVRAAVEYNTAR